MKLSFTRMSAALGVATLWAGMAQAGVHTTALSDYNNSDNANDQGSVPVAIVADCQLHNSLQILQFGADSVCIGNRTKLCAPTLSSPEVRAILSGTLNAGEMLLRPSNTWLDDGSSCNNAYTAGAIRRAYSGAVDNSDNAAMAIREFTNSGDDGAGQSCGVNAIPTESVSGCTDHETDEEVLACVESIATRATFGFAHVTALDDAVYPTLGFIKLDGVAPALADHLSANYNLVSNLNGVPDLEDGDFGDFTNGMMTGVAGDPTLAPMHRLGNGTGAPRGCGRLNAGSGGSLVEPNGGPIIH